MEERLLELKDFCQSFDSTDNRLHLSENDWDKIACLKNALLPARIATKTMQSEQLTAGPTPLFDFYISYLTVCAIISITYIREFYQAWLQCEVDTKKVHSLFTEKLFFSLKNRETSLFCNEAFLTAIYLDPKYRYTLSPEDIGRSRTHLVKTSMKIKPLEPTTSADQIQTEELDEMDLLIQERERERRASTQEDFNINDSCLMNTLIKYEKEPRPRNYADVHAY